MIYNKTSPAIAIIKFTKVNNYNYVLIMAHGIDFDI